MSRKLINQLLIVFLVLGFLGCSSSGSSKPSAANSDTLEEIAGLEDEDEDELEGQDGEFSDDSATELSGSNVNSNKKGIENGSEDVILQDSGGDYSDSILENRVRNIKYLSGDEGGVIAIETKRAVKYSSRVNLKKRQFVVELSETLLPVSLKRPYILKDFEGSFAAINAYQNGNSATARVVVQWRPGSGKPKIVQRGRILTISSGDGSDDGGMSTEEVASEKEASKGIGDAYAISMDGEQHEALASRTLSEFLTGNNKYYGKKISIQLKDADIIDVINFIAEESGLNVVISDDVTGKISLKIREIPWDQALVIVMRAQNLGYLRQGKVLRITTLARLQAETEAAGKIIAAQKTVSPTKVKVIPVSYAKVEDMVKQVQPFLSAGRGKVVADKRTSSLIVTDIDEVIVRVGRLIKELDIPPAQVMIEGKIVEATEQFTRDIGIRWGLQGDPVVIGEGGGVDGSDLTLRSTLRSSPLADEVVQGSTGLLSLNVGTLDFLGDLSAALALSEAKNLVKIVSSPRIMTINKEKAEISQSSEIVNITTTIRDGEPLNVIGRVPLELSLKVTPQITANGGVIMDIEVTRDFPGPVLNQATLARAKNSRKAKTKVLVESGETAVLGGIYQGQESENIIGVPLLKDIPVLGWLFKSRSTEVVKNELLVFLTPRILNIADQGVTE